MFRFAIVIVINVFSYSVAPAADLIGTVRRSGSPARGVTVVLDPSNNNAPVGQKKSTTSDKAGRYVIFGVVPGQYNLICTDGKQESEKKVRIDFAINRHDCDL
jgi:hypothetical protein